MKLSGYISFQEKTLSLEGISFTLSNENQKIDTGQRRSVFFVLEKGSEKKVLVSDFDGNVRYGSPELYANQEDFKRRLFDLDLAIGFWYNSDKNELFLVRDIFGFTPLYYFFVAGNFFAFSTSVPGLASIKEVKRFLMPNLPHIANYLYAWGFNHLTNSESIFHKVYSVLPGHSLTVKPNCIQQEIYLNFGIKKFNINSNSLSEYGEQFKELFADSLKHLTAGYSTIGMHLSGGLDSSSISCMMSLLFPDKKYNTFYLDPLSEKNEDIFYVHEVLKVITAYHTVVKPEGNFRQIFYDSIKGNGQPSIMVSGPVIGSLLRTSAMENSCEILLSGNGGDEIVGHGLDYPLSMLNSKDWDQLLKLMKVRSTYGEHPEYKGDWNGLSADKKGLFYFNNYVFQQALQKRDINKIVSVLVKFGNISTLKYFINIVLNILYKRLTSDRGKNKSLVQFDLPALDNLEENVVNFNHPNYSKSVYGIYSWKGIRLNEELINMDTNSIKQFYPFYNRNLYEFSLSIPSELKYNSGLTRGHLRYAMKGILPTSLQTRAGKFSFSNYSNFVANTLYSQSKDYLTDEAEVWTFVNKNVFKKSVEALNTNRLSYRSSVYTTNVFRTISLALWLDWYRKL